MNFFEKMTQLAEKVTDSIETTVTKVNKAYKEKGIADFVEQSIEKTNQNVDKIIKKAQDFYEQNREDINKSKENKEDYLSEEIVLKKENIKEKVTQSKKSLLIDILMDGEVMSLDCIPLEIVLENLNATKDARIPNKWKMSNGSSVQVVHNKWFNFNKGLGEQGAINLIKFSLSNETSIVLENKEADKHLTNDALVILQNYQNANDYQTRLSTWIKNEMAFTKKRKIIKSKKAKIV